MENDGGDEEVERSVTRQRTDQEGLDQVMLYW